MSRANASAGRRDRLVTVQQLTEARAGSGFPGESWTELCEVWANKVDATTAERSRERFVNDQESAAYETTWTLPYRADLDPELVDVPKTRRLVVRGRVHDIIRAVEVDRRAGVEVLTRAGGLLT